MFDVHVTVHRDKFLIMEPTRCTNFSKCFYFGLKLYMFHRDPARKLSADLYDIHHCCVYSGKLLMMDRGTVRNMESFIPRINLRN